MPLSRLIGYYCLLLVLSTTIFARWLPLNVNNLDTGVTLQSDAPAHPVRVLRVSLAPTVGLLLTNKN